MMQRLIAKFYGEVSVSRMDGGFSVLLDGKPVKTPARATLTLPTDALAEAAAAEWRAQSKAVDPATMPLTGLAYAALDLVPTHRGQLIEHVLGFGRSDLLCYRADAPAELAARQADTWDPLLAWAAQTFGVVLQTGEGVTYIEQPAGTRLACEKLVASFPDFELAALDKAVSLTGSLVLSLALKDGRLDAPAAFAAAHIDEDFQAEKWGQDAEAQARRKAMLTELDAAGLFLHLLRSRRT